MNYNIQDLSEEKDKKRAIDKSRKGRKDNSSMATVVASIGRNAHISPNHLVGAITELLDIPGSSIGKIDIMEESSTIGMYENDAQDLLDYPKTIRVKGVDVTFTMRKKQAKGARRSRRPLPKKSFRRDSKRKSQG